MTNKRLTVACLGPISSYSHQVAVDCFQESQYKLMLKSSLQEVLEAVQLCPATYGVMPFENSTCGPVLQTLDLFMDEERYSNVFVVNEVFLDVDLCLLGKERLQERTTPDFRHIYSHPQALSQCSLYLAAHHRTAELHETPSTSNAAELVAADKSGTTAAIASSTAARVFGLDTIAKNIENCRGNSTRFLLLQNVPPSESVLIKEPETIAGLVSLVLGSRVSRSFNNALMVFETHGLDVRNIYSRSNHATSWKYVYFIEFTGKVHKDHTIRTALHELDGFVESWRLWGYWKPRPRNA